MPFRAHGSKPCVSTIPPQDQIGAGTGYRARSYWLEASRASINTLPAYTDIFSDSDKYHFCYLSELAPPVGIAPTLFPVRSQVDFLLPTGAK